MTTMVSRFNSRILGQIRTLQSELSGAHSLVIVRGRKDYRLPKAPSKIYVVRQPTPRVPEETEFLMREYAHYRTSMRAINKLFKQEVDAGDFSGVNEDEQKIADQEEYTHLMELNRRWNEDIANMRAEREVARQQERESTYLQELERFDYMKEQQRLEAEERLRLVKEAAKDYIAPENLDEAIERALDSVSDYNFAIDLDGGMVKTTGETENSDERTESVASNQ